MEPTPRLSSQHTRHRGDSRNTSESKKDEEREPRGKTRLKGDKGAGAGAGAGGHPHLPPRPLCTIFNPSRAPSPFSGQVAVPIAAMNLAVPGPGSL